MDDRRWEQAGAMTGLVFVALAIVGAVLVGTIPKPTDSTSSIASFIVDHRTGLITQSVLFGAASAFFLWWGGTLRSVLRRGEGETGRLSTIAFGGAVATSVGMLVPTILGTELAFSAAASADLGVVRVLYDLMNLSIVFISLPAAVVIGAASLAVLRTGVLSRWIGALGFLAAGANLATIATLYYTTGAFAPGDTYTQFVPLAAASVWILAATAGMIQRLQAEIVSVPTRARRVA